MEPGNLEQTLLTPMREEAMTMSQAGVSSDGPQVPDRDLRRRRIEARIRQLERASMSGLWAMVLFMAVSFAAFEGFSILPELTDEVREILGKPPPSEMISLALVIYAFSGIVHTLARMTRNIKPYRGFVHALFFTAFYLFYYLSDALADNFWAVFFAGLSVMGLESYYLWAHSSAEVRKEKALLASLKRDSS
jgi:O-antigen/teichoic acid export membrane protein